MLGTEDDPDVEEDGDVVGTEELLDVELPDAVEDVDVADKLLDVDKDEDVVATEVLVDVEDDVVAEVDVTEELVDEQPESGDVF